MSVEELRKIAKEEASKFIMENLNSVIIFTYIQNLEKEIENLKEINKEHQKLNGELRDEIKGQGNTREIEEKYIEENFISKDKIRKYIKENKRIYEMKTPNRNRVIYKDCVLLTKEVKELLEE